MEKAPIPWIRLNNYDFVKQVNYALYGNGSKRFTAYHKFAAQHACAQATYPTPIPAYGHTLVFDSCSCNSKPFALDLWSALQSHRSRNLSVWCTEWTSKDRWLLRSLGRAWSSIAARRIARRKWGRRLRWMRFWGSRSWLKLLFKLLVSWWNYVFAQNSIILFIVDG